MQRLQILNAAAPRLNFAVYQKKTFDYSEIRLIDKTYRYVLENPHRVRSILVTFQEKTNLRLSLLTKFDPYVHIQLAIHIRITVTYRKAGLTPVRFRFISIVSESHHVFIITT